MGACTAFAGSLSRRYKCMYLCLCVYLYLYTYMREIRGCFHRIRRQLVTQVCPAVLAPLCAAYRRTQLVYVYLSIYLSIYLYLCISMYIYEYISMYICIYVYMYIYTYILCVCVCACVCVCVCVLHIDKRSCVRLQRQCGVRGRERQCGVRGRDKRGQAFGLVGECG